jgi:hypothetical protein
MQMGTLDVTRFRIKFVDEHFLEGSSQFTLENLGHDNVSWIKPLINLLTVRIRVFFIYFTHFVQ